MVGLPDQGRGVRPSPMRLFSQRQGLKPVKVAIQLNDMDTDLRSGLWSLLIMYFFQEVSIYEFRPDSNDPSGKYAFSLCRQLWFRYFKHPLDTLAGLWSEASNYLRKYFFSCQWNEAYDFVEFVGLAYADKSATARFQKACNDLFEREVSGYRFVDGRIAPITSEEEIVTVEEAANIGGRMKPAAAHFLRALQFLADRKSPDYRNSIKESISGVEAACKLLAEKPKADLNDGLRKLKEKVSLHPALEKAFASMYGYTSDEQGIRHSLLDESSLTFEDAKFMLVSCAAFVNYLRAKAARSGLNL